MSHNSAASTSPERPYAQPGLISSMKQSLASGEFKDVQFMVGRQFGEGKLLSAHKYVLCLQSSVFRAMFYGGLAENCEKPIDIADVPSDAFANMLSFLYTDAADDLCVENVIQTFMCADKYDLPQLVDICCDFVSAHLSVENCLTILENGIQWHAEEIVKRCLQFIDRHAEDVLRSEHFSTVDQKMLVMILQRDTLFVAEHSVYLAVERWAQQGCKTNNMDPSGANRRQILGEAFLLVRFPLLTSTQLADGPAKSDLLLQSEVQELHQYKFAKIKPALPFSTDPRRVTAFRINGTVFKYREKVFVRRPNADIWYPAEIMDAGETEFYYTLQKIPNGASEKGSALGRHIVRAADLLKYGQGMLAEMNDIYMFVSYNRAHSDQHVVNYGQREYTLPFADLAATNGQVAMLF
ncbi:BTB/POZ domain-containing protein 6-A-like [Paramacrobiotus metropolitanus]|uniref:BTB/POZ domain-containing protein 6-A-like n=1 Tax=Paramacrobiotus metropolitanus TaxID=2943436 RepID=UPI002445C0C9|nr:BTB/POZ domain-containing protein 6-A-like [Paramacrobiotus metropolitanus]